MNPNTCPNCNIENRPGARFCARCGNPLYPAGSRNFQDGIQSTLPTPIAQPDQSPSFQEQSFGKPVGAAVNCPICGNSNLPDARICSSCGQPLMASPYIPVEIESSKLGRQTVKSGQKAVGSRRILWIGLALLASLVCVSVAVFYIWQRIKDATDILPVSEISTLVPGLSGIEALPSLESITTAIPLPEITDLPLATLEIPTLSPITVPGLEIELPHLSDEEEIEIGREAAAEFERENKIVNDPEVTARVERIGQSMVPHSQRTDIPYTFKVVDTDEVNAFALPGGFIYVTRGMLDYTLSDDELAAVIGHEIAHVALRHSAQLIENLAATQAALDVVTSISPELDQIYQENSTQLAIDAVAQIVIAGWGRENELDADENGTIYMSRAGFRSKAVLDLLNRMAEETENPSDPFELMLATHPPFEDRIERVERTIEKYQLGMQSKTSVHNSLYNQNGTIRLHNDLVRQII